MHRCVFIFHCYLLDVVQRVDLRRKAPVHAEELLVHQGGQRQAVKCLHAGVVNLLRVLDLTWRQSEEQREGQEVRTEESTQNAQSSIPAAEMSSVKYLD